MHKDFHFLRAIFHQPDDDDLRLVYADWLDDHGDPRAEVVRLEVEYHRLPKEATSRKAALQKQMSELWPKLDASWRRRMWWVRNRPAGARLDLVCLEDGKGLIEVRGNDQDTVLLVEGKPVALNWDDCSGSVGQYLVFTGHTRGSDYARELREFVAGNVDEGKPLTEHIGPLLDLFVPGIYSLCYTPSEVVKSVATLDNSLQSSANQGLVGYYPAEDRQLVFTQTSESLNEDRVRYYQKRIQAGERPIVLTTSAEGAWCEFVIDGHHKLEAYNRQAVEPTLLGITRWNAPPISLEEGLSYLPGGHHGIAEYRRFKG